MIIAEATTSLKRLSVSAAMMELDLTGAACIVFQHGSSGRVNIIYRRPDGNKVESTRESLEGLFKVV